MKRLTISLDDDLYAMARAHAVVTGTSISKAIGDLLRQRNSRASGGCADSDSQYYDAELGLLVSRSPVGRTISQEEIQRKLDEDLVGPMENAGLSGDEIMRRLEP